MSTFNPEKWHIVSPYLDKALTLTESDRAAWLDSLRTENADLARDVQELLNEHQSAQQDGFLENSPLTPHARPGLAGQVVGAYRLISPIGYGGMGTVWLAERNDGRFERKAAVKFLRAALVNREGGERFKREGSILGRLSHPNIAELLDAGVADAGQPYLVLEYVEGQPIDLYCDERKLDVRARVQLFLDVLGALAHAHSHLIVHRDIKPSNVLVNHEGQVKLLDFGIAKLLDDGANRAAETQLTQQAGGALTPAFAAPEQVSGGAVTVATDVYASGILLYLLLTGKHPAGSSTNSPAELVKAIVEKEPLRPSLAVDSAGTEKRSASEERLRRQLRGDLDVIVLKTLSKEPRHRYATANAFAEDLQRYLDGEAVLAQPESSWYRTRKFLSRYRWAVASASAVVLALAVGLGVALWQAHIARRETRVSVAMEKFLEDIFRANSSYQDDPVKARQTTARELLDIGARKIDDEFAGVPEVKIRMLRTLGIMYSDLGLSDQTVGLRRKRVDLIRNQYGNNSLQLAQALIDLGSAMQSSKSVKDMEGVLLEAKKILDSRGDFSSTMRGNLAMTLAQHYESSDLKQALNYSQEAVQVYRKHPDDPLLPESLYEEGLILSTVGKWRESEPRLTEAIQLSKQIDGDPNASLARYYAYLGETQEGLTEFGAAEDSLRGALSAARKLNGEDHIDTLETEMRLGQFLVGTSRTAEGLEHIEKAKEILLRTRGADDPFFAPQIFLEYGRALHNAGHWEDGLSNVLKAIENRRKNRPGTRYLAQMLYLQSSIMLEMGRSAEAQRLLDEGDQIARKVNYPTPYLAADARARQLIATGRTSEADAALDAFHAVTPPAGALELDTLKVEVSRAENALARNDFNEASRLAGAVSRELSASSARDYMKWLEARAALVQGLADLRLGHPSDALPLLQRAVELRQAITDPVSPLLAFAQVELALCYLDLGDSAKAKDLADTARKALDSHRELGVQYLKPLHELEQRLKASPHKRA